MILMLDMLSIMLPVQHGPLLHQKQHWSQLMIVMNIA